jgi:hypothetical protein
MTNNYDFGKVLEFVREISLILRANSGKMAGKSGVISQFHNLVNSNSLPQTC